MKILSARQLIDKFIALNINEGDIVFVSSNLKSEDLHLSQRRILLKTLQEHLGSKGSIIMSLANKNNLLGDVENLQNLEELKEIRKIMPIYNYENISLLDSDILAKALLYDSDYIVSEDPSFPYIGVGKYAKLILQGQSVNFPNGNMSPLARMYELRSKVLLINHNIVDFLLNDFVFETKNSGEIGISGRNELGSNGEDQWTKYLTVNKDSEKIKRLIKSSDYTKLFYYSDVNDLTLLSTNVREYIDYCRRKL